MNRNICRVCLKKGMLSSIFTEEKYAPYQMIMECTLVKVSKEDTLPPFICQECANNLKISFQFKRLCESSDFQLRKVFTDLNIQPDRTVGAWMDAWTGEVRDDNKYTYNYYERPVHQINHTEHNNMNPSLEFKTENRLQQVPMNTMPTTSTEKIIYNNVESKTIHMKSGEKTKGKKKIRNPQTWKSYVRKDRREKGLEYEDVNKKLHPARAVKGGCGPHCRYNCMKKFSLDDRNAIFDHFYQLSDERKTHFFNKFTARDTPSRKRTKAETSRKSYVFKYSLMLDNIRLQVCKTFFCNTLDISQSRIYYFHDKILNNDTMIPRTSLKGKNVKRATPVQDLEIIRAHIRSFPIVDSHYCQKNSGKIYLESSLSLEKMYNLYRTQTEKPVSKYVYRMVFKKDFNIAFQKPKKDKCDACEKLKFPTRTPTYFTMPGIKKPTILSGTIEIIGVKTEKNDSGPEIHNELIIQEAEVNIKQEATQESKIKNAKRKKTKTRNVKLKNLSIPEKCEECGKLFYYSGYLKAHLRTHSGERPFDCKICQKSFTQVSNLILHKRTHTGEKPFQCEVCSKQFSSSSNLSTHRNIHKEHRSHKCTKCSKTFKSLKLLENHSGIHTGVKNHICKLCGKRFYKTSYLTTHVNTVHVGEKKYKCIQCDKTFSSSSNLNVHFRIHSGEKPFVCELCNARFNQSSSLQRHKKQHAKTERGLSKFKEILKTTTSGLENCNQTVQTRPRNAHPISIMEKNKQSRSSLKISNQLHQGFKNRYPYFDNSLGELAKDGVISLD